MLMKNIFRFGGIIKISNIIYRNLLKMILKSQRDLSSNHQHLMIFGKHHIHIKRLRKSAIRHTHLKLRKILAMPPQEIVKKTLNNTTPFYLSVEEENFQKPRKHYRFIFTGLRYHRQRETVSQNIFFLHLNHHVVILVQNYSWGLHQIGGV